MKETKYAFMDDPIMNEPPDPHVKGTIERGSKKEFWLSRPCPPNVNPDNWEESEQARWDKIFKRGDNERN